MKNLTLIKVIVVAGIAATITVVSFNVSYFEIVRENVQYGIWFGFPFGYYFDGYFIDWSVGGFPSWLPLSYWVIRNWILDFVLWLLLVGSLGLLIEIGLKKVLRVTDSTEIPTPGYRKKE